VTENTPATSDNATSAAVSLADEIKRRRHAAGMSQPQLAQAVSYSRQYVSLAERPGANLPSQALVRALDAALNAEGALTALHAQARAEQHARRGSRVESRAMAREQSSGRCLALASPAERELGEDREGWCRRDMLSLAGVAIAGTFLSPVEHTRRLLDSALGMPTTELDTDEWEHVADEYSRLVGRNVPISTVLPQLLTDFDEMLARIEAAPESVRARLIRVAALFSALIAIALLCADCRLDSNRYWRTAQRAADSTGDRKLSSLIRGRRAVYELYDEADNRGILNLADTALDLAGDIPSAGKISARAARAQALAKEGARQAAREELRQLERDFDHLPDSVLTNDPPLWGWSEQKLRFVQSFVHSYAGNIDESDVAQSSALSLYGETAFRGPTQIKFHRAIAMAADGDQLGGARYVLTALETVPENLRTDKMIYQPAVLALDTISDRNIKLSASRDLHELSPVRTEIP